MKTMEEKCEQIRAYENAGLCKENESHVIIISFFRRILFKTAVLHERGFE